MRKHFLILMLFALLPLAGWATDITDVNITLTPNAITGMHYTGTDSAFPTIVVSGENGTDPVADIVAGGYAEVTITAKVAAGNTASMSDFTPGTYVVTVTATDGNSVDGTLTKEFTIVNAEIATVDPVLNDAIWNAGHTAITGYGVTYNGQAHQVIKTAAQASVTSSIAGSMTIYYSLNATGTGAPSTTEDVWYTDITAAQLAVTNAGTYDIYYRVDHTNSWVENTAAILVGKTYTVSKANPTVTVLPTAKNLTYTSGAQDLITTGTASAGTLVYKIEGGVYGSTNVSPKATGAGDYIVKYKILGNDNYNDYEPTWGNGTGGTTKPITVTINRKLLKVKPVAINTFFGVVDDADAVAITYDGFVGDDSYTGINSVFTGSYTAPVGAYSPTINIAANKTTLSDTKNYFNVGTYTNGLVATASDANTGAANYELVYQSNNMTISAAAVKLTLNDGPDDAYYGTPEASVASWPVKYDDVVTAVGPAYTGKLTVGIQDGVNGQNEPTYATAAIGDLDKYLVITDETNPADNVFEGLTISRANTAVTPQKYALTLSGATATSNTYIAEEVLANENVVFEIKKAAIAITPNNDWKIYGDADPEQLTYTVTLSGAPYALTDAQVTAVNAAISRAAGEPVGDYKITIAESAKSAFDTDSYTITLNTAWFSIEKRDLIITALPQTLYVGDKESEKLGKAESVNWTIEGIQTINGVKDAYNTVSLAFNTSSPSVPTTGTATNKALDATAATTGWDGSAATATGVWVNGIKITIATAQQTALAKNYNITLNFGTLTVVDPTQVLVLNSTLDNTDGITAAAEAGVNVNVTVTGRTLAADTWSVLVLPFTISTYDFIQDLGCYAVFNRLKSAEGTNVKFGLELSELKANEPFLVKPQAAITTDMLFDNVEIVDLTPSKTVGSATFVGTYAPIKPLAVQDGMYTPQGGKFVPYTTESTFAFPATMAYLLVNATGEARITVEEADGSTTAISNISADGVAMKADGWYTVNGVKLQGMPTEKGIYINNGKKVVIK